MYEVSFIFLQPVRIGEALPIKVNQIETINCYLRRNIIQTEEKKTTVIMMIFMVKHL